MPLNLGLSESCLGPLYDRDPIMATILVYFSTPHFSHSHTSEALRRVSVQAASLRGIIRP